MFARNVHTYLVTIQHNGIIVQSRAETKRKALAKACDRYADNRGAKEEWIAVAQALCRQVLSEWRGREHIGALSVSEGRSFAKIEKF